MGRYRLLSIVRCENGEQEMKPIELKRRYPNSRDEDIIDAFMRGYQSAKGEIVRCKDCEYYTDGKCYYPHGYHDVAVYRRVNENDFCGWAKMKGGAE